VCRAKNVEGENAYINVHRNDAPYFLRELQSRKRIDFLRAAEYYDRWRIDRMNSVSKQISLFDEAIGWQAVQTRDANFDGLIYYGVRSTGIYCRPSCASRQPKRENVIFFALPEAARQAGFRSCLRCSPDTVGAHNPQAAIVQRLCHLIAEWEDLRWADLSAETKLSESYLHRLFKKLMGITPRQYAEALRTHRFKAEVRSGKAVTEAMYEAGYSSSSRLYEKAAQHLGMTPATYRKGGTGLKIRYLTAACSLGRLLVAATDVGLCAVTLGEADEALEADLRAEFPQAELRRDTAFLKAHLDAILQHLNGQQPHLDLPLDVRATAFQQRVWEELRRIPYGHTASYSDIARRLGQPAATRAVARACAANPVALLTPCHRVIRENGELSGYRWGLERKRQLLAQEHKHSVPET
jgi:AraC family transcriptional regulator, regulatory protein of adaptative response / methylated-DNA-[protein]-cysteine methyltransferase